MGIAATVIGAGIIAIGLRDVFRALMNPRGEATLSTMVFSAMWAVSRRCGHRLGSTVGPAGMVGTVLVWVLLQAVGWALIYLPRVPEGFDYSSGIDAGRYPVVAEALYISLVTLATLGFGDVVATDPVLRVLAPVEALTGFALLTASLTWFMQVYPPLTRRRALALRLHGLAEAGYAEAVRELSPVTIARAAEDLAAEINAVTVDLSQHSETYYFQDGNPHQSLSRQVAHAVDLRDAATESGDPESRVGARALSTSLDRLAESLGDFVDAGQDPDVREVFDAYAGDHWRAARS
ncbi:MULTISPECIES: potassium channel family protein [unclassified Dietzia]|uniref:potassium channel family protein n=1 Tax=unclassified Dietzia TaxID=2617939 RepID=UPI000D20A128|nr:MULTISPECIES: potassium channel family protein [unclassified Dietzia]AVZ39374.1 transporter [Dietzia sp. JS16-p6b]MBB1025363.1 two pore domain potassium channel family protein [Dietzia sp. DQ12-76]MBB1026583.1 two pore domain potassium channel family protein [Dietzia sp. DQ11-38-2]QGW24636.1 Ion transport 2 domain-containing protein [Dietzia sp. DQ12-45-1b]